MSSFEILFSSKIQIWKFQKEQVKLIGRKIISMENYSSCKNKSLKVSEKIDIKYITVRSNR